ncbi:MAG: hypothetical protein KGY45_01355 [Hadesarchaea archaeon]|nr:hypothetical protein [Hadesarchaea archaeon]
MTLEHSDFQDLFEKLMQVIEEYKDNPAAMSAISSELSKLYKQIPIYPGIISMSIGDVVETVDLDDLEEREKLAVVLEDNKVVSGEFVSFESGNLKLKNCQLFRPPEELEETEIPKEDIQQVSELKSDILAELWPSLDFEVEE